MAANNITKAANIQTTPREIDFVSRFNLNWQALRDIMGVSRLIRQTPGTVLKSKVAKVTLAQSVGEGEVIPYSEANVVTIDYATINVEKYAKGVTIEAIQRHGYNDAVGMTDDALMYELQNKITGDFYDFLNTGRLISAKATFQAALAEAQGRVRNQFKKMHRGITNVVGFCNILDAYDYLGVANITVQSAFGMNYIENFIGYSKLFLASDDEIPRGKVVATPEENIICYYVSPDDSEFAMAGLAYTTDGETNLIGVHVQGNYGTATSEIFALQGMVMMAEYIDGVCVTDIGTATFTAVVSPSADDIATYFEKDATTNDYFPTLDTTVDATKTYYTRTVTKAA